jgi:thiamine-monophosphate kinase
MEAGEYVFVQDGLVEHCHFDLSFVDILYVGKKAVYVNVSDCLSMGAIPRYFLITIGIPKRLNYRALKRLYSGIHVAAMEFGLSLIGGDTMETYSDLFIDISMTGRLITKGYLGRDKAATGDLIGVTGLLGESAYGLELLKAGHKGRVNRFIRRYLEPKPPYETWKELVKSGITNAMMDISDGLLIDLERMMKESRKCAQIEVEHLPIPYLLKRKGLIRLALSGGEDYQFLFTFPRDRLPVIKDMQQMGIEVSVIGEVLDGRGVRLFHRGKRIRHKLKGYEHFGANP